MLLLVLAFDIYYVFLTERESLIFLNILVKDLLIKLQLPKDKYAAYYYTYYLQKIIFAKMKVMPAHFYPKYF